MFDMGTGLVSAIRNVNGPSVELMPFRPEPAASPPVTICTGLPAVPAVNSRRGALRTRCQPAA